MVLVFDCNGYGGRVWRQRFIRWRRRLGVGGGDIVGGWIAVCGLAGAPQGPRKVLGDYIRRRRLYGFEHPARSRIFAAETMRGAPLLRPLMGTSQRRTAQAVAVITAWVDAGLMRPVDPLLLLFHIWAVTQHYADYEHQIAFFRGQTVVGKTDRVRLIAEVTAFVLQGAEVHPRTQ